MATHPPTTHPNALPIGFSLREYRIQEILGVGGFGITYRAKHENFSQKYVAIKEYLPAVQAFRDSDSRVQLISGGDSSIFDWGLERFFEEANNLHRLRHPSIVNVENVFKENGTAYMVMDVVEGVSTAEFIRDKEELSELQLWSLLEQLTSALQTVHAGGLIHRDITPANILFRRNARRAVLIDFGSSREQLEHTQLVSGADHTRIFTPGYAPIEQHEGTPQDQRSDIYGLSASLYHLALHIRPAPAAQRAGALREQVTDPLQPAAIAGRDKYSPRLLQAIDRGLELLPADRPADVKAWSDSFKDDGTETTRFQGTGQMRLAPTDVAKHVGSSSPTNRTPLESVLALWEDMRVRWSALAAAVCIVLLGLAHATGAIDLPGLTSAERLISRANTELLANPMTRLSVTAASDYFTNAKLLGGDQASLDQTRAGENLCERVEFFQRAIEQKNLPEAERALGNIRRLAPEAGADPGVAQALADVLTFESLIQRFSTQVAAYALKAPEQAALEQTITTVKAAADSVRDVDEQRIASLERTVTELSAAQSALAENRFGKARSQLAAAAKALVPAAYFDLDVQPALQHVRNEQDKFVAQKIGSAADKILAQPADIATLAVARVELAAALTADVEAEVARNWAELGQGLISAATSIQDGKPSDAAQIIQGLGDTANTLKLSQEQWDNIVLTFSNLGTLRTLEGRFEELSREPFSIDKQTQLATALATAQNFAESNQTSKPVDARTAESQRLLAVLERFSNLLAQSSFADARRYYAETSTQLGTMASGPTLQRSIEKAIDDQFVAERKLREGNAIAAANTYALDSSRQPLEAAARNVLSIDSENSTAAQLQKLTSELDAMASLARNGEFANAQNTALELGKTASQLGLDAGFVVNQQNWLQAQATASSNRLTKDALANLARNPLAGAAAQDFAAALERARKPLVSVGITVNNDQTQPDQLTRLLPKMDELRLASASGQFDAADTLLAGLVKEMSAISADATAWTAAATAAVQQKRANFKTELHLQVTDSLDQAYLTLRRNPLDATAHLQVDAALNELGTIRNNLDASVYNWQALADAQSVLAILQSTRGHAIEKLEFLQATKTVVNASMEMPRESRWQRVLESGRTQLEVAKNEQITGWLTKAGDALAAKPFAEEALVSATESYEKVVHLEGSRTGKGNRGMALVDYLRTLAAHTNRRATGNLDLGKLNDSEDRFSSLPGAVPALATARSQVQDLFASEDAALLATASSSILQATARTPSASSLQALATQLQKLSTTAKNRNLQKTLASSDNARAVVASAQRAQAHIEMRRFESAYTELRSGRAALRDSPLADAPLERLRELRKTQLQTVRQQRVNNLGRYHKEVEQAVKHLQQGPLQTAQQALARRVAKSVLAQHAEFGAALRVNQIIDILASLGQLNNEASCTRVASAKQLSREIKYPMNWAWLDEVRDSACN